MQPLFCQFDPASKVQPDGDLPELALAASLAMHVGQWFEVDQMFALSRGEDVRM